MIEDNLIIAYEEIPNNSPCLVVARKKGGSIIEFVNTFWNNEAKELYKKLTEGSAKK